MNDSLPTPDQDELERRAYFLWEQRGCPIGSPEVDWLLAEQELLVEQEIAGSVDQELLLSSR